MHRAGRTVRPDPGDSGLRLYIWGMITESMTWITPLEASMSVETTLAPSTITEPFSEEMEMEAPLAVSAESIPTT